MRMIGASIVAFGLVACTPNLDVGSSLAAYRSAKSCCADFSQVSYEKLLVRQDAVVFTVGDEDLAFAFPGSGMSRFKAFELPGLDSPYTLVLRSYLFAAGRPAKSGAFFFPKMTLLDAGKRGIAETSRQQLTHIKSSIYDEPNSRHRLEVSIAVKPSDNARYLLVHTFAESLGVVTQFHGQSAPLTVPVGGIFVAIPAGSDLYSAIGSPTAPPQSLKLRIIQSASR